MFTTLAIIPLTLGNFYGIYGISNMTGKAAMLIYRLVAVVAAIVCIAWTCFKPGWDSGCAALAAVTALTATFLPASLVKRGRQAQTIGDGGIGIQAGRDAKIGTIIKKD